MSFAKRKKNFEMESKDHADTSQISQLSQTKKNKIKQTETINRLYDYGRLYKQKQVEREEQIKKSQTFKPNITKSGNLLHVKSKYKNFSVNNKKKQDVNHSQKDENDNELLKYTESNQNETQHSISMVLDTSHEGRLYSPSPFKHPSKQVMKIQDEYDKNHPFHPTINTMSKAIVEHQREFYPEEQKVKKKKNNDECNFQPELNKNSEEIIRLMKEGNDYDHKNRWKSLYNKGVEKQIKRKEIEEREKEKREINELNSFPFSPEIHEYEYDFDGERPRDKKLREQELLQSLGYTQNKELKEFQECTFKPRLIAKEKLKGKNRNTDNSTTADILVNPQSLENYYRRMEEAHYRRKEMENYEENFIGSGNNWQNKLTLPTIPDFHEKNQTVSLDQVKAITKPVVRDGEIVKDPFIQINRHDIYKKSDLTAQLRENKDGEIQEISNKNEKLKEPLFEDNVEFDD